MNHGYYKNKNNIYYKCIDNCDKCDNGNSCINCKEGYKKEENKNICVKKESNI